MAGIGDMKNTSRMISTRRTSGISYDENYGLGIEDDNDEDDPSEEIIQLSIEDVFHYYIYNKKSDTREYLLRASFMEICNIFMIYWLLL